MIVALIAGLIGYLFGCTRGQRERVAQAQETETAKDDGQTDQDGAVATQDSPVKARARDFYAPNSEALGPNEMRLIACGTDGTT